MAATLKTSIDSRSLCVVLLTVFLILSIVVTGVLVNFFVEQALARIILITLICILSTLGISILTYLEFRKRTLKKEARDSVAKNGYLYNNIQPSAPRDSSWEYTSRSGNARAV